MPKAYWIAHVTVYNPDQYKFYASDAGIAFKKFNAQILARGGAHEQMEGNGRPRNVVIEFPSLQAALDCYRSEEYQSAKAKRKDAGEADIVIVEGV
ncbi:MAG: DUF1330 domain-containing protein [Alphaproteobacteria bacterium]|nr:DUF1330 domain-containing protein [Alphaproteobacteria bacterium]